MYVYYIHIPKWLLVHNSVFYKHKLLEINELEIKGQHNAKNFDYYCQ